jgi:hypothetical protein
LLGFATAGSRGGSAEGSAAGGALAGRAAVERSLVTDGGDDTGGVGEEGGGIVAGVDGPSAAGVVGVGLGVAGREPSRPFREPVPSGEAEPEPPGVKRTAIGTASCVTDCPDWPGGVPLTTPLGGAATTTDGRGSCSRGVADSCAGVSPGRRMNASAATASETATSDGSRRARPLEGRAAAERDAECAAGHLRIEADARGEHDRHVGLAVDAVPEREAHGLDRRGGTLCEQLDDRNVETQADRTDAAAEPELTERELPVAC